MNEEKKIILRMLQEQKISMEEAEALLEAVEEAEEETGPAAAESSAADEGAGADRAEDRKSRGGWFGDDFLNLNDLGRKIGEGVQGIVKDLDFDRLKTDITGIVATIKDELKDVDFDGDLGAVMNRAFGKSKAEGERELTVQPEGFDTIQVDNTWGSITNSGSDDRFIHAVAKITAWGEDERAAAELLERVAIGTKSEGGLLTIRPEVGGEGKAGRFKADFTLTVPKDLAAILRTKSGDIGADGIEAKVDASSLSGNIVMARGGGPTVFRTKSGDVKGTSLSGDVTVSLLSGNVHLEDVEGGIECSTKSGNFFVRGRTGSVTVNLLSGDIEIEDRRGPLELRTKSGDIRLEDTDGPLDCKTMSGDIRCRTVRSESIAASTMSGDLRVGASVPMGGKVDLKTIDGDVELTIPADTSASIHAESKAGSVTTGFADLRNSIGGNGKRLDGVIGGGGAEIAVSVVSGDVKIDPAG